MSPSRCPRRQPGFTIVEILVVVAIIAILAALFVGAVSRVRGKADEVLARSDISQLDNAIAAFKAKMQISPPSGGGGLPFPAANLATNPSAKEGDVPAL